MKSNRRFSRSNVPLYLQHLFSQSAPHTPEPSTPPATLNGPNSSPSIGISQPRPSHPSTYTPTSQSSTSIVQERSNIVAAQVSSVPSAQVSSAATRESTHCSTTTRRRLGPRRNVTSNAPRDANNKLIVVLSRDYKIFHNHLASLVTTIFQQYPQAVAWQYKMIPAAILQKYWEEFKKECVWDTSKYSDDVMKKAFLEKLKERYPGILTRMRKSKIQPRWCPNDVWDAWWRVWNTPEFKRRSDIAKKIRGGKDGVAKGTHVAGSLSHEQTLEELERELDVPLTPDQDFLFLHTKNNDGLTFVNDRCKETQERFETLNEAELQRNAEELVDTVDELRLFYEAAGGINRDGEIFGLGSAASRYYSDRYPRNSRASSSSNSIGASTSGANSGIHEIRTTLETVQERLNGLNDDRNDFMARIEEVSERQQRVEQGIHLQPDANAVRELRERLTDLE